MVNKKGIIWNTLGSAIWGINSFAMLAAVSNFTSVETAGSFGIAFTTAQILYILGQFGSSHYHMTDYQEKYTFRNYAYLRLMSCVLMILSCGIILKTLNFTGEKATFTILLTILMLMNNLGDLIQCLFFQKNRLDLSGSALFFRTLCSLIVFCGALAIFKNVVTAVVLQLAVNTVLTAAYAFRAKNMLAAGNAQHTGAPFLGLVQDCFPLFLSLLLMNITLNASKYGVELTLDDTAQGYFSMIFMPAQVINLGSQFIFKPFLNQYSQLLTEGSFRKFRSLLCKQGIWIGGLTAVCCIGAWLMGIPVLSLFYGQSLQGYRFPLILILMGGGVYAACDLLYYIFVIMRMQTAILWIYAIAIGLSMVVSYLFTMYVGITGAALAFLATQILILLMYLMKLSGAFRRMKNV